MNGLQDKTCIVTGGAGFVGVHLTQALLRHGAQVTVVDDLSTSRANVVQEFTGAVGKASFIQHDISEPIDLQGDFLFNLACPASPKNYQRDPLQTWKTSVLGALHLGEMAVKNNITFVQASTSEVYGDPHVHPQIETYWGNVCTQGIRACYDEGKRAAETYLTDLSRVKKLDLRIARIFNTFGAGMALDDGRVMSNFVLQALKGRPLTLFGDGSQTRSLCYVDDLVDGLILMALTPAARDEIMNLGNPAEYTVRQIADLVLEVTGIEVPLDFLPLPQHDPVRRCPDISKAKTLLGWQPKIETKQGLSIMVEDFRARLALGET